MMYTIGIIWLLGSLFSDLHFSKTEYHTIEGEFLLESELFEEITRNYAYGGIAKSFVQNVSSCMDSNYIQGVYVYSDYDDVELKSFTKSLVSFCTDTIYECAYYNKKRVQVPYYRFYAKLKYQIFYEQYPVAVLRFCNFWSKGKSLNSRDLIIDQFNEIVEIELVKPSTK